MSRAFINKFFTHPRLWLTLSLLTLVYYLSPLLHGHFYVPYFDNLDSNVIWYKIIAESGKIFAENNATIPNMMNGLPRSTYPSEFNLIVWMYHFWGAKHAYILNEIMIHITAFFSMYLFLKKYIVVPDKSYGLVPVYVGSLYFALLPFWSGAGLTVAILPLVTYALLNIKNRQDHLWEWIFLALLPLYSSFIFLYMFYIILAGIYLLWDTIRHKRLNIRFFAALILMGVSFLISEYRLVLAMFFEHGFVSHRTEFQIFFNEKLLDTYRKAHQFFISGHLSHLSGLQYHYLLPFIIFSMIVSLIKRRLSGGESLILWLQFATSLWVGLWNILLTQIYTLGLLTLLSIIVYAFSPKGKTVAALMILQILLALFSSIQIYENASSLAELFPILKELNIIRIAFIQPFLWAIMLGYATMILFKTLRYTEIGIVLFMLLQIVLSIQESFYQSTPKKEYASFESYYAPKLFAALKQQIPEPLHTVHFVSYGLEPAVLLYNGLYTVDGYSVNYPLSYKHRFRKVIADFLDRSESNATRKLYDDWGGKVYILTTPSEMMYYQKGIVVERLSFDVRALCALHTDYFLSSHQLSKATASEYNMILKGAFYGEADSWDLFLYRLKCPKK